jgi:hypothetical protein
MQAKIRKQRQEQLYAQQEMRARVLNIAGVIFLCTLVGAVIMWLGYLFYQKRTGQL